MRGSSSKVLFLLVAFISLFVSFQFNYFGTADQKWFDSFQFDSESYVVGRLAESKRSGWTSHGGRLGRYPYPQGNEYTLQTMLYIGTATGGSFKTYDSQIGLHGMLLSSLDRVFDGLSVDPLLRINIMHILVSLLGACALTLLLAGFFSEFGFLTAAVVLISMLCSQWMIVFGRNLYWVLFGMYFPIAGLFLLYRREFSDSKKELLAVGGVAYGLLFLRFAMGYEYITTIMVSALIPTVYFYFKNKWEIRKLVTHVVAVGVAAVSAFATAMILQIVQASISNGKSFFVTVGERIAHAQSRIYTSADTFELQNWKAGANANLGDVFQIYLNGDFFGGMTFGTLIFWFGVVTALCWGMRKSSAGLRNNWNIVLGLMACTWIAFLGSVSWFALAKVHSAVHGHMNHIVWHLPFTFFGFALFGYFLDQQRLDFFKPSAASPKSKKKKSR